MKKASSNIFMFAKVYRTMTLGRQGASYFRRYGRELVSKPAISVGGAAVERLPHSAFGAMHRAESRFELS